MEKTSCLGLFTVEQQSSLFLALAYFPPLPRRSGHALPEIMVLFKVSGSKFKVWSEDIEPLSIEPGTLLNVPAAGRRRRFF
jgi:hypothetical protein